MLLDKNIDLIGMAVAVYHESTPAGYGSDQPWYEPLPREDVVGHRGIVIEEDAGNLYMDYVNGRRCKCWVSHWYFNNEEYDVVHGPGAALRLVDRLARRRPRKQIMLTGSTLKQVRQKIQDSIPLGSHLLREEVINDGAPRTMECTAASSDYALQKARMVIPRGAEVVHEETHENRTRHTIRVQEFDEETAKRNAFSAIPTNARLERTTLIERGKKGFLGVGRKPNTYVMCYSLSVFVAKVTFREAASLQITYE